MQKSIYDPQFVQNLFDEMSSTYGVTNYISSFGFCERWRRACVDLVPLQPGMVVYDLMTGMGECWHLINQGLHNEGRLVAVDISERMCTRASQQMQRMPELDVQVRNEDFLRTSLPDASADAVIAAFGLKTFSDPQLEIVAQHIARVLKPGGHFSLLEISVPPSSLLRAPYMGYLKRVIPLLGKLFLGNPDNYRMLGVYTEAFQNGRSMQSHLSDAALSTTFESFFFGCATAIHGVK